MKHDIIGSIMFSQAIALSWSCGARGLEAKVDSSAPYLAVTGKSSISCATVEGVLQTTFWQVGQSMSVLTGMKNGAPGICILLVKNGKAFTAVAAALVYGSIESNASDTRVKVPLTYDGCTMSGP